MINEPKTIYALNPKGERKLADIIGPNKNEFYIDTLLDLESAKDHQEPTAVSYGGQVFYFDDSDFEEIKTAI